MIHPSHSIFQQIVGNISKKFEINHLKRIRLIQFCRLGYTGSTVTVMNLHIDKLFLSYFDSFTN